MEKRAWYHGAAFATLSLKLGESMYCKKLQREGTSLARKPMPGEIGERIVREISREAWDLWLARQTMLINEYQLSSCEPEAQAFLRAQMEDFLFGARDVRPERYRPAGQ